MQAVQFQLDRADIRKSRFVDIEYPQNLNDGEVLLSIDRFALTANNISYAATGDVIGYWKFFPVAEPWGLVPVWGFADVIASNHQEIKVGERIYGFLPFASHVIFQPGKVKPNSFVDVAAHRVDLPPIYNDYLRIQNGALPPAAEDIQMLFQPLFATSFLLHDFFEDNDCFGAANIILGSASSKTAMGVARLFAQGGDKKPNVIGLTSAGNKDFVQKIGDCYQVYSYDELNQLPIQKSVYIDMAGNAQVKRALHEHLTDAMVYSCAVGISHWDKFEDLGPMPGAKPIFFFAPDQALKRRKEWGGAALQSKIGTALQDWASTGMDWLNISHGSGKADAKRMFAEIMAGQVAPDTGYVLSLKS